MPELMDDKQVEEFRRIERIVYQCLIEDNIKVTDESLVVLLSMSISGHKCFGVTKKEFIALCKKIWDLPATRLLGGPHIVPTEQVKAR